MIEWIQLFEMLMNKTIHYKNQFFSPINNAVSRISSEYNILYYYCLKPRTPAGYRKLIIEIFRIFLVLRLQIESRKLKTRRTTDKDEYIFWKKSRKMRKTVKLSVYKYLLTLIKAFLWRTLKINKNFRHNKT